MTMLYENLDEALEAIEGLHKELNRQMQHKYKVDYLTEIELARAKTDKFYDTLLAHAGSFYMGFMIGICGAILLVVGNCYGRI